MASHNFHSGPEGAVLYDGCAECDARAKDPLEGLLRMDHETFQRLEQRMYEVEYEARGAAYLTDNEAKVGKALYAISVLNARHGGVLHR